MNIMTEDPRSHFERLLARLPEFLGRRATTLAQLHGGPEKIAAMDDPMALLYSRDVGPQTMAAWTAALERMGTPPSWHGVMHYWPNSQVANDYFQALGRFRTVLHDEH